MPGSRTDCARDALPVDILVHGYLDIDHGRLFDELDWIENTEEFAAAIEHWLEQNVDHV